MASKPELLFFARPSLRRANFLAVLYACIVLYGRIRTNLDPEFNPVWIAAFLVLATVYSLAVLRRWTTSYCINSEEIISSTGILARQVVVVPLSRVTNAVAQQSVLERILGLVNLQIDSPGGDAKEMVFTRILKADALAAEEIIREIRQEGDATEASAAPRVQESSSARITKVAKRVGSVVHSN